jgi:CheY-like chemotaxis protein
MQSAVPPIDVVVVDDSPVDRLFYCRLLSRARPDWNVKDVNSTSEAERICQSSAVKCLVLDHNLPETTGLEFLKDLRSKPWGHVLPVVMISGSQEPALVHQAYEYGASAVLAKGLLNTAALRDAVERAIRGERDAPEATLELLRAEFAYACVATTGRERDPGPGELAQFALVGELCRLVSVIGTPTKRPKTGV